MKNKNIVKIIVGIIIFIYVFISSNALDQVKNMSAAVFSYTNEVESKDVNGDLLVYFIDVGQADSVLVQTGGHNMLIDAGNNEDGNLLVSYLKDLKVENIDYLVGTHPHEDHIGGMDDVINNFKIGKYFMPEEITTTKTFLDVLDALENNNLTYIVPKNEEEYNLGDSVISVIHVGNDKDDLNDSSIVLRLTYGNNSFLFTGDISSKVESEILSSKINVKSDVLKVAHHGSNYSSTTEFLKAVSPKYAVISVGKNNIYNHPSFSTLNKLDNLNVKVFRTDEDGTILFKSNGNDITVQTLETNTNG